jgi:hypothetical protein
MMIDTEKIITFVQESAIDPVDIASYLLTCYAHNQGITGFDLKTKYNIQHLEFSCKIKFDYKYKEMK